MVFISSKNNEVIKNIRSLEQKKYRDNLGIFLVEGEKSVSEAIKFASKDIKYIVVAEGKYDYFTDVIKDFSEITIKTTDDVFKSISNTISPQGIACVLRLHPPDRDFVPTKPFVILDGIQDPGNLGSIIRSALATGFKDIILIECTDPYSDKVLRSSTSGVLLSNLYQLKRENFVKLFKKHKFDLIIAEANKQNIFEDIKTPKVFGLVIGNEGRGVSEEIKGLPHISVSIPMQNNVESLNAAVSASIIMYLLTNKK